ncbi:MAG TPA: hypothetical protein VKE94_19980, partial [Gemmataceae bacterium]|nr:hypothetical protein [Gemmataceae bacterium]
MSFLGSSSLLSLDLTKAELVLNREERRSSPRSPSCRFVFVRAQWTPAAAYQAVSLWDITARGIGLYLHEPPEAGDLLDVQFRHASVKDRVAEVVHATETTGGWLVGCLLNRPLTAWA